ncbi:MAG: response regulator [Verrucomicrobia bacterium]|nr:response regulator [Verrucomicrobiota bacterium]
MDLVFNSSPESLRAGLLVSLLSVWLLVGLFAYLNHYTKRRYFTMWTAAWLFYALWLTLNFVQEDFRDSHFIRMARQWCVGTSAVFLFWGSLVFMGQRVRQTMLGLFMAFLLAWSYVSIYHMDKSIYAQAPIFAMLGIASFRTAYCFFKYQCKRRYIGASLLGIGLVMWGVYLGGYPFWEEQEFLRAVSFFLCGVLQLFIAVSMIMLVLEEARATLTRAIETTRSSRQACAGLKAQVRVTEDRYRKLFDQASDGIVITNTSLDILELNPCARRLLGLAHFEPGHSSLNLFIEDQGGVFCPPIGPARFEQIRSQRTLGLVATNGAKTPVEAEATAIEFEGEPAYQFAFRELTERVRLEQQLRQSEKLSALGQMISGIAHELNNPLAVIKGYLDLILTRHRLPDGTRSDLEKVAHESSRAAKLVRNFLSFAREQPAQRTEVNINQVVERVAELRKFDLRSANVEMEVRLSPDVPLTLADADQVQQVLVNLVNNALQAMTPQAWPGRLRLSTERFNGLIRVAVEDSGPGVPKQLESKIFEPFFTTKEVGKGTGLGLSIAHSIMSEHNGRIYYQPSVLGGAGFIIEFPVVPVRPALTPCPEPPVVVEEDHASPPSARAAKVLVLDDERALAEMLGQIVTLLGHDCTLCHSPVQALEHLQRRDFDLVLSDYRMPVMDGQQFYKRVVELKPWLASRIVFLTGDVVNEDTQSFLSSIGNACLTKPFQLQVVEATINRTLIEVTEEAERGPHGRGVLTAA